MIYILKHVVGSAIILSFISEFKSYFWLKFRSTTKNMQNSQWYWNFIRL